MRQLTLAVVAPFVLAAVFVATASADSHPTTGATTGATTVTAVPQTGAGMIELSSSGGTILLFVLFAALMAFASLWHLRRA